jgi:raffinose/stachyose/melibiose transport system substrate-binding protein
MGYSEQSFARRTISLRIAGGVAMTRRGIVAAAFLLLGCALVFPGGAGESTAAKGQVTLAVWAHASNDGWVTPMFEEYMKANPSVQLKYTGLAQDVVIEQMKVAAGSGTMPNMWWQWSGLGNWYFQEKLVIDLTDIAAQNNWSSRFLKAGMDLCTLNGRLHGIPYYVNGVNVWYNKAVFQKLNVQVPQTPQEFDAICDKALAAGIIPIGQGGESYYNMRILEVLIERTCGSQLRDQVHLLQKPWDCPEVVAGYALFKKYADRYLPKDFLSMKGPSLRGAFYEGKAAMTFEGPWLDNEIANAGYNQSDFGIFPYPSGNRPARISVFGNFWQIASNANAAQKAELIKLANWMTDVNVVNRYIDIIKQNVAVVGAKVSQQTPNLVPFNRFLNDGGMLLTETILPPECRLKYWEFQDKVLTGELTPAQAATGFQAFLDTLKK